MSKRRSRMSSRPAPRCSSVALPDGFLQQHVLEATLPDGTRWEMPACVIVRIENGHITRLDEYLDSAHAKALNVLGR